VIGRTFQFTQWATVDPQAGWSFLSGFFTQTAKADLFGYHPSNGTLWVGENTGLGFRFAQWGNVTPVDNWQFVAGDFTGAGTTDVVGYHPSNGTLWLFENTGTGFSSRQWGTVEPPADWQFLAGFFTGQGKSDLFGYHPSNGTLWVGENTESGFRFAQWGNVTPAADWQFVAGDFTGAGTTDVVGYHPSNGTLWVGQNLRNMFQLRQWSTVGPPAGWQFAAGYFSNRGKADLVGYHPSNGTLWVGENTGDRFEFWKWGTVTPTSGWQFIAGPYDADLWADVVGYHPSNGILWIGKSTVRLIEGYCWPLSAAPGESISFMVSGEGSSFAVFRRHISVGTTVTDIPMGTQTFGSNAQAVPPTPWRTGFGWAETFKLTVPDSWPSGIYTARCSDAAGNTTDITFVIRPAPTVRSQVAILANVNTWLAYNGWGGRSKYDGAARVSFLRPNPVAGPEASMHLTRGELWPLGWLEQEGHQPDVYTDIDFHNGIDLTPYRCLLITTHPEYWSVQMYDNLVAYLNGGGSVLYLAGNGLFEIGEYEAGQQVMAFRNGVEDGPREDALFRVQFPARPELSVLGVATERCGVLGSPFEVLRADHFCFEGTGLANGDTFGDAGLNTGSTSFGNGKASAWEVDTFDGPGALRIPGVLEGNSCAMVDRSVPVASLPPGLILLARGRFDGIGRGADMTYYEHAGGGFVFSAGSITFCGSLVIDPSIQKIVRNVLAKAGVV
jgi:hypothetical protein